MKRIAQQKINFLLRYFLGILFFLFAQIVHAQNIAVNNIGVAAASTNMFEVTQTNTAANMVAIYAINQGTGAGSSAIYANHTGAMGAGNTGYAVYATKTGGAGVGINVGGLFTASGGASNYAIVVPGGGGNVGIGTSAPASLLHVAGTMQLGTVSASSGILNFHHASSGFTTAIREATATASVIYTLPPADGTNGFVLTTNGSGTLSWASGSSCWTTLGNGGTTAGTNFLGTTDVQDLVLRTNSVERLRILSTGNLGIGHTAPASLSHVAGSIHTGIPSGGLGGAAATNGSILFYNSSNANITGLVSGTTTASVTYTLPTSDGTSGYILQTDGEGNLSWVPNAGPAGPIGPIGSGTVAVSGTFSVSTGTTTYTFSPGAGTVVRAELWGGGGGGASGNKVTNNTSGGGGGGGCYGRVVFTAIAGTYTAYIGAGGAGGVSVGNGSAGGNSYIKPPGGFANICEVGGGAGGTITTTTIGSPGGAGGVAISTGIYSCDGGEGGVGSGSSGGTGASKGGGFAAGSSFGGGGGAAGGANGGSGGIGGGGGGSSASAGHAGGFPGGGGGGGSCSGPPNFSGGAGANGMVVVTY